jgi:hypothetical protein
MKKKRRCRLCGRSEEHGKLIEKTIDNQRYRICKECNEEMV